MWTVCAAIGSKSNEFKITARDKVLPCLKREIRYHCSLPPSSLVVTSAMLSVIIAYFVLYCWLLFRAIRQLRANPKADFKMANTVVRIQVRYTTQLVQSHSLKFWMHWTASQAGNFRQCTRAKDERLGAVKSCLAPASLKQKVAFWLISIMYSDEWHRSLSALHTCLGRLSHTPILIKRVIR